MFGSAFTFVTDGILRINEVVTLSFFPLLPVNVVIYYSVINISYWLSFFRLPVQLFYLFLKYRVH